MSRTLAGARLWVPFYLVLAFASGYVDLRVRAHPTHAVDKYIPEVIAGTADAPGRYRVLAPFLHGLMTRVSGADPMHVWLVGRLCWFMLAWFATHAYLRTWFDVRTSILGTATVAALLPTTYTNSWAHPDHVPELALFTLGCLAAARRDDFWFAVVLLLATLNRETAVFLLPVYLVAAPVTGRRVARAGALAALWAVVFVGLRAWLGYAGYDMWQLWRNLEFLKLLPSNYDPYYRAYAWFGVLTFGPLLYLAAAAWHRLPPMPRRMLLVVPVVGFVALTISSIIETRILTPVFPLILPGLLFALGAADPQGDAGAALSKHSPA